MRLTFKGLYIFIGSHFINGAFLCGRTHSLAMSLSVNCLIHGDNQEKIFTVEIEKTKNVSILKDLIKEKKAPHLDHVAASDLHLYQVDLRLDELGEDPVHVDHNIYSKLSPTKKLSSFFVDDELLHIIAKAPSTSQQSASNTSKKQFIPFQLLIFSRSTALFSMTNWRRCSLSKSRRPKMSASSKI